MMRTKNWIKCVVAASLCLTVISCRRDFGSKEEQVFVDNFKALVMGGKEIDARQDWNTVSNTSVRISVDYGNDGDYTVYISQTPLIFDTKAVYIGMVHLQSGVKKTINIARPANTALLYAACYDASGHAVGKFFPVTDGINELTFTGKSPTRTLSYSSTVGHDWSVPDLSLPDLTRYTTGTLVDPADDSVDLNDEDEVHFHISSDFTGFLPSLGTFAKKSAYVTATWTLAFNQQVLRDNVLIVGEGGNIVIPKNFRLTSKPMAEESSGMIYVLPGGQISGDGTVEFATESGIYSYNAGVITAKNVSLYGGTLYNSGTLGSTSSAVTTVNYAINDKGTPSMLVNNGIANLAALTGDEIAIQNGGYMRLAKDLLLNGASRMDDGSYTECSTLTLSGDSSGDKVLHMGNSAYMNCTGSISIDNYGVHGPSGDGFIANAILKVNNCTNCVTTDGVAGTYLLDHVELVLPSSFPTILNKGAINEWDGDKRGIGIGRLEESYSGYNSLRMLYYWLNGYEGRLLNADSYQWTLGDSNYCLVWNSAASTGIDAARQTCTYSTSPSYDYSTFMKTETGSEPESGCIYYFFETLESATKDFDYNDVGLRISTPQDNGDGTFTANVQVMCVGNKTKTTVLYNGEPFGEEVHAAIGTAVKSPVNTSNISRIFSKLGEITFSGSDFLRTDRLNFSLSLEDADGNVTVEQQPTQLGDAPLYFVVNGNKVGKWFWPREGLNIGIAYPQFSLWASDVRTAIDWYDSSNSSNSKIITY